MNNILATGYSRYTGGVNTEYIKFDNQSTVIGESAGKSLYLYTDTLVGNYYNTFLGFNAGKNSIQSFGNVYIGYQAGMNIENGTNNIVLGHEYDNGYTISTNDIISIGMDNITSTNSMSIGSSNFNSGYNNVILGKLNDSLNTNNVICIGNENVYSNIDNSVIIGHDNNIISKQSNNSNIIILGNNNIKNEQIDYDKLLSANPILIGNDLNISNNNFVINIGNTFLKYDNYSNIELICLGEGVGKYGSNSLHTAIGFSWNNSNNSNTNEIYNLDTYIQSSNAILSSVYINNGLFTDSLTLGSYEMISSNIGNYTVTLVSASNLTSNVVYSIPDYPDMSSYNDFVLSTNTNGNMYWKKADFLAGTTDSIRQGTSNLYYNSALVDARIDAKFYNNFDLNFQNKISTLNLDTITNGTSNKYISNGTYNRDLMIFGTLTVNRLRVLGVDVNNESQYTNYMTSLLNNDSNMSNYIRLNDIKMTSTSNNITQYVTTLNNQMSNYVSSLAIKGEWLNDINALNASITNIDNSMSNYVELNNIDNISTVNEWFNNLTVINNRVTNVDTNLNNNIVNSSNQLLNYINDIISIAPSVLLASGIIDASYNIVNVAYKKNYITGNLCKIFDVTFKGVCSVSIIADFNNADSFTGVSYHLYSASYNDITAITQGLSFSGNNVTFDNSNVMITVTQDIEYSIMSR